MRPLPPSSSNDTGPETVESDRSQETIAPPATRESWGRATTNSVSSISSGARGSGNGTGSSTSCRASESARRSPFTSPARDDSSVGRRASSYSGVLGGS